VQAVSPSDKVKLSTERLILRPLGKASARQVAWLRDPDVVRFSEQRHKNHTLSTQLRYISSFIGRIWAIYLIKDDVHIGNLTAAHDAHNNIADVGILIGEKAYWGKGYGHEAWNAACNWLIARDGGGIRKLEAGCMKENTAMLKIIRKSRFVQEGERPHHFLLNDVPVSAMLFGRTR
jgi:[ribosomal protein S5]-alanine N-acetyltransferase